MNGIGDSTMFDARRFLDGPFRTPRGAIALLAPVLVVIGVLSAAPPARREQVEYTLGAGDSLRVTVFGQDDLSGEFEVDGAGFVSLPLVGEVAGGNLTVRQFVRAITDALKPDYLINPRVSVQVLNYRPFYILGEVKNPGSYPFVNGMKVINAIALAGGYTYRARENNVTVIRATNPAREKEPADHDSIVLPGDVIEVPERFF